MTDWITHRVGLAPAVGWRFDLLGLSVGGRALYLAVLAAALLGLTAPLALRIGGEIRTRWITWAMILPVVGIPIWTGRAATTALATLLAVGRCWSMPAWPGCTGWTPSGCSAARSG
jgi:phosphatidate cytidylyltransferase